MQGTWWDHGAPPAAVAPAVVEEIRAMVAALPPRLLGARDRALLLVGFASGFRRSELVALDVADVEFRREGLLITLRRSKTDPAGQGRPVGIPYGSTPATCPVRALQDWLAGAGISEGPVFRPVNRHGRVRPGRLSDRAVARVVPRSAQAAGLDAVRYAGHSPRAGLATSAAAAGVPEWVIARQTGHRSTATLRRYIRQGEIWSHNAAARVGL